MGTRGYFVYRFRGRYYALYVHYDCYPSGLGNDIVYSIPEDPKEYQNWLQAQRALLAKWDWVLESQVLCIPESRLVRGGVDFVAGSEDRGEMPKISRMLDERLSEHGEVTTPCYRIVHLDLYIEYTYVIDLDREVFTVNNAAHFKLNNIPRQQWTKSLLFDQFSVGMIIPHRVPFASLADLPALRFPDAELTAMAFTAQRPFITTVEPKGFLDFPMIDRHGPLLLVELWDSLKESLEATMPWVLRGLTPDEFAFREIAFAIVSLSAGLTGGIQFAHQQRLVHCYSSDDWSGIILGGDAYGRPSVLSKLGIGYHAEGAEAGSSPMSTIYWFNGVLIKLEPDLTRPDRVHQAIAHAVNFIRSECSGTEIFDAILLSIEHAVLIHVVGNTVQRTKTLSLLNIPHHYISNPVDRYKKDLKSPQWHWRSAESGFDEEISSPPLEDSAASSGGEPAISGKNDISNDNAGSPNTGMVSGRVADGNEIVMNDGDPLDTVPEATGDVGSTVSDSGLEQKHEWPEDSRAFFGMVHLFEAAAKRSMPPERAKEGLLPTEIYELVLSHVDDKTYQACSKVSRKFRRYCLRNIRFLEGIKIVGLAAPFPEFEQSEKDQQLVNDPFTFQKYALNTTETLPVLWEAVRFIVDDDASDRQGAYAIGRSDESTTWTATCGSSDRLTSVGCLTFANYRPPSPWKSGVHKARETQSVMRQTRQHSLTPESDDFDDGHYWSSRPFRRKLSSLKRLKQPTTRALYELWYYIVYVYQFSDVIGRAPVVRYAVPSHTAVMDIDYFSGSDHRPCVCHIRFKRPNAIVGASELWDLGREEAEQNVREAIAKQKFQEIFVIIVVDFYAELYRWDTEQGKLIAVEDRRLSVLSEGDRELIELFLLEMRKVYTVLVAESRKMK